MISVGFALAMLAQAPVVVTANEGAGDRLDVAYEELRAQENSAAVQKLEALREVESRDPSALLNLSVAYARLGRPDDARAMLTRVLSRAERQEVQLASGQWIESRQAARMGLSLLETGQTLALR